MVMLIIGFLLFVAVLTPIAIALASTAKTCPACKEIVHPEATVCSHCQCDLVPTAAVAKRAEVKSSPMRLMAAVLVTVVVMVGGTIVALMYIA